MQYPMRSLAAVLIAVFLLASHATAGGLKTKQLDADQLIKGLPLHQHQSTESGDGRAKQRWEIDGADSGSFEIIGDIQSDADLVGWRCSMFNKQGNRISPVQDGSFCRQFFVQVLGNVISDPEAVANDLLIKAKRIYPESSSKTYGDISVETDTEFYFIRRLSRM